MVELSSVAAGYQVEDAMLKAASVELLVARTICSGKYLIVVAGDVASVTAAVETAATSNEQFMIEKRVLSKVHPAVFPAIGGNVSLEPGKAGGPWSHRNLFRLQHHRRGRRGGQKRECRPSADSPRHGSRRKGVRAVDRRCCERPGCG